MSEYQYYEFQALDRKLSEAEMRALRELSTRAQITPTSFINEYSYGDFRGSPETLMEKYFDAHLYLANWGAHRLMLRLPRRLLDEKTAATYCSGHLAKVRHKGEIVILDFNAEADSGDGDWEEGGGQLASLLPIRAELAGGDLRVLYLAWLLCAQAEELSNDDLEPPVPPKLGRLSPSLEQFADFFRIDPALIEVAAEGSEPEEDVSGGGPLAAFIEALPLAKKNEYLLRLADDNDPHLRAELLQTFQQARGSHPGKTAPGRTVASLLAAAEARAEENRQKEMARDANARARREQKEARELKKRLDALAKDEPAAWRKVDALIAAKDPSKYDEVVKLLVDLRALASRDAKTDAFKSRVIALRAQHKTRQGLLNRLGKAGLSARGMDPTASDRSA